MSRSLTIQIREEVLRGLNGMLEADFRHARMLDQKVTFKRFGSAGFGRQFSFGDMLPGKASARQLESQSAKERGLGILTAKQKTALSSLASAGKSLGYREEVKALPRKGEGITIEFFLPKDGEKVPIRRAGGGHEA